MEVYQDGVPVYCLPEEARCELDPEGRNPLELDECPLGEKFLYGLLVLLRMRRLCGKAG